MANYDCPRCGYTTEKKSNIKRHLNIKEKCKPTILDIDLKEYEKIILREFNTTDLIREKIKLEEKVKNQESVINSYNTINSTVNSHNNNITNHITINIKPFDNPELGYITEKDIKRCLKSLDTAML